jgi:hypothetical protein
VLRTSRTSVLVDACVQSASQLQFKEKYFYVKSGVPLPAALQYCHAMPLLIGRLLYSKLHPNRTNCNFYMLTICRDVDAKHFIGLFCTSSHSDFIYKLLNFAFDGLILLLYVKIAICSRRLQFARAISRSILQYCVTKLC